MATYTGIGWSVAKEAAVLVAVPAVQFGTSGLINFIFAQLSPSPSSSSRNENRRQFNKLRTGLNFGSFLAINCAAYVYWISFRATTLLVKKSPICLTALLALHVIALGVSFPFSMNFLLAMGTGDTRGFPFCFQLFLTSFTLGSVAVTHGIRYIFQLSEIK